MFNTDITQEDQMEVLIRRARSALAFADPTAVRETLVNSGVAKDLAFFAVQGARVLEGDFGG